MTTFPDRIDFATDTLQFNNRYLFALETSQGQLWFRPNTAVSGRPGDWALLGPSGRPTDRFPSHRDKPVKIHCDHDFLLVLTDTQTVYRVIGALNEDPATFTWKRHYGWPFDEGPALSVETGLHDLCVSSALANTTVFTTDQDGNRHARFICHIYALSKKDHFIHHNDPWTPGDWEYAFPLPEAGRFVPGSKGLPGVPRGINASAGVVGVIGPGGVYTVEYDFDLGGGNPMVDYTPVPQPHYPEVAPLYRIEKGVKPVRFPTPTWEKHPAIPGPHTAHLQVSTQYDAGGHIVEGSRSRILRVLGWTEAEGRKIPGYWEKQLEAPQWAFVPGTDFEVSSLESVRIDTDAQQWSASSRQDFSEERPSSPGGFRVDLRDFGRHDNFFDPATLVVRQNGLEVPLRMYTHIQMRTSRQNPVSAVLSKLGRKTGASRSPSRYLGAYLLLEGEASVLGPFVAYTRPQNPKYLHVLLRLRGPRVEVLRPALDVNADVFNLWNRLFGRRLFRFQAQERPVSPEHSKPGSARSSL